MAVLWSIWSIPTLLLFSKENTSIFNVLYPHHTPFMWKLIGIWAICGLASGLYLYNSLLRMLDRIASARKSFTSEEKKKFHFNMSSGYALFVGAVICGLYSKFGFPSDITLKAVWIRLIVGAFAAYLATTIALRMLYKKE
jgi:hypothetical protein